MNVQVSLLKRSERTERAMAKKKKRQAISDISKKQTLKLGIKKRKKNWQNLQAY